MNRIHIFWCPDCDLSFEHDEDDENHGVCPECGDEGEFVETVEDLQAA